VRALFELHTDFIADGLNLPRVASIADDEVVGEAGDAGQVENLDVGGLLRFRGANGDQPGGGFGYRLRRRFQVGVGQSGLLYLL
jgi:hypothetical protein